MEVPLFLLMAVFTCATANILECQVAEQEISCVGKLLNSIPKIHPTNKIELLDMSQNELEELYGVDFSEYKSLTTLYLGENSISYVEDDTFEKLPYLEVIDLSKNLLEEIPDNIISNNKNVTLLDLSDNLFQSQTPKLISNSLEVLDLSKCKIKSFSNESLINLPNLRLLYLNSNNLVSLDVRIFSIPQNFYYVEVDYNPWECSCNTVKMLNRLTEKSLYEVKHPISCVNPDKSHVHIYDADGPIICKSKKISHKKSEVTTTSRTHESQTYNNEMALKNAHDSQDIYSENNSSHQDINNGIIRLEEILKNEKIYFHKLKEEKDVLDTVTVWTVKIFIFVIFLSGIGLGVLISTWMNRKVKRYRSNSLLSDGPYRSNSDSLLVPGAYRTS